MTTTTAMSQDLLTPPPPQRPRGCWFSCCLPKPQNENAQPENQHVASKEQGATERTLDAAEDEVLDLRELDSYLDAKDREGEELPAAPVLGSDTHGAAAPSHHHLATDILHALMGIFMINYFLEIFHHQRNNNNNPKMIAPHENPDHAKRQEAAPEAATPS